MIVEDFKQLGKSAAYSTFNMPEAGSVDSVIMFDIPLGAGSSFISILDKDKEVVFSGFDILRDIGGEVSLTLEDLGLDLDMGGYYIVIDQAVVQGHYIVQNEGFWEPEVSVPEPSTGMLLVLALVVLCLWGKYRGR